jgi:hypothetical protein
MWCVKINPIITFVIHWVGTLDYNNRFEPDFLVLLYQHHFRKLVITKLLETILLDTVPILFL